MLAVNARSAEFYQAWPKRLVRSEVELALAVVSEILSGSYARLQPISADNSFRGNMDDDQMIADGVKFVVIVTGDVGGLQPFVQLQVEYFKTQAQCGRKLVFGSGKLDQVVSVPEFNTIGRKLPLV